MKTRSAYLTVLWNFPGFVQVVMVVGAGRGPLVRAVLSASKAVSRRVKVYAVEKNPNAAVTLLVILQRRHDAVDGRVF